ncbi:N-acetylmuramoyl-L-alanine amidase [Dongshaea marina]|uniref:N-acetylmuramoyl-L-alanine amidase n=1 Tax=Dongshaea marina TaxID=2047966 RepID=UPI000D3E048E|nr:N-acetylmuramoyl-L-alanine amidase [Dongshaea marina]
MLAFSSVAANRVNSVRVWSAPDKVRVVLDLRDKPDYSYFTLTKPNRLVVDLSNTKMGVNLSKLEYKKSLLQKIRGSTPAKKGSYRLVFELKQPVKPVLFPLQPVKPYGDRLVIDLPVPQGKQVAKVTHSKPQVSQPKAVKPFPLVIAIDPGHGGEDPGSIGAHGRYEKTVTLAIAKRLQKLINQQYGMKAILTRTGDYYVGLTQRSEIARKSGANLLISIHADSFASSQPRGASVWVLSLRRANREMGRWLEDQEKQSELLGGVGKVIAKTDPNPYLTRTFLDLSMDRSRAVGYAVSLDVVRELKRVAYMHKDDPQHASLAVLKSPDIPSLLVETGFISNPHDNKLLFNDGYRQRVAEALFRGIKDYYLQHAPKGSMFALRYGVKKYVVQRGDSLSVLAKRNGTSMSSIRKRNNLKSNNLRIGQVLYIPRS